MAYKILRNAYRLGYSESFDTLLGYIYLGLNKYDKAFSIFSSLVNRSFLDKANVIGLIFSGFFARKEKETIDIIESKNIPLQMIRANSKLSRIFSMLKVRAGLVSEEEAKKEFMSVFSYDISLDNTKYEDLKEKIAKHKEEKKEEDKKDIIAKSIMELLVGNKEKALELFLKALLNRK
jgi:tetratricopeptide (TPR) repeat protein